MVTETPESAKDNGSPNVRMGQKRTINSPVTIKKMLPMKKLKKKEIKRKPVGIKKAKSRILTSTPCRKLIEENHEKKTVKRMRKVEIAKKLEEFKKEVAKKERMRRNNKQKKYQQRRQQKSKPRKRRSPRGLEGGHGTPKYQTIQNCRFS